MNTLLALLWVWLKLLGHFLTRTRTGRFIVFLSLPLALLVFALWDRTDHYPPIFDAQVHYNIESWDRISVKAILNTAEKLNVPWMLVGSTPNEGTWRLQRSDPQRIIPMLVPYRTSEDRDTWFKDDEILHYIEEEIERGIYRGIGEFHLFDGQVNSPVVKRVVELAAKHDLVLHARSDPDTLRQLFALNPYVRILWAHAGMFSPAETIDEMLEQYPQLWAELSHRIDVAPRGNLSAEWRELLLRYPDRFLLGTGTYTSEYWYQFRYSLSRYRGWLKNLPQDIAEKIAFRNGLALFGLD